ncbi:MAG: PQQ-dependent sugar dehydrogenase [Solirubrobacterales bacterium]|nr:PQQ-dependent sugar dehydrogenase [Solirubrobacterales bacterium]
MRNRRLGWRAPLIVTLCLAPPLAMTAFAQAGGTPQTQLDSSIEGHTVASGLNAPTAAAWAPDGRLFVAEKQGTVRVVLPGEAPRAKTLIDISGHVATHLDRGLLGIAVDSDFTHNGYLYLLYTYDPKPTDTQGAKTARLTRVTVGAGATLATGEKTILGVEGSKACPTPVSALDCMPSDGSSHSIGTVRSSPDGTLWVGIGDGVEPGSRSASIMRPLNTNVMSGAIMHIDRNGHGLRAHGFCPTVTTLTRPCTKIFAKGFRNPYRFTVLPGSGTRVAVGDVGYDTTEELDFATSGHSYGWPCREGAHAQAVYSSLAACKALKAGSQTDPVYEYSHAGGGASIMAGPVLGDAWPGGQRGKLVVGDYARGTAGIMDLANPSAGVASLVTGLQSVVDMEPAPDGGVTMVEVGFTASGVEPGRVWVLNPAGGNQRPWPKPKATVTVSNAVFDAGAVDADSPDLTYAWDFGDGSSGTGATPSHTYTTPGMYYARVTVSDGSKAGTDVVPVAAGLESPVINLSSPLDGAKSTDGATLNLAATATVAGVALPPSAIGWTLILHHGTHDHFLTRFNGRTGSVKFLTDHDAGSWYDLIVRATTPEGQSAYTRVSLHPNTHNLTLQSTIAGQQFGWTGRLVPQGVRDTAVGLRSTLTVPATVMVGSVRWRFSKWSDGSRISTRTLTMPNHDLSLKATYIRG